MPIGMPGYPEFAKALRPCQRPNGVGHQLFVLWIWHADLDGRGTFWYASNLGV